MVTILAKCKKEGCLARPSFGLIGEKVAEFCKIHSSEGLHVDLVHPKCLKCETSATFGYINGPRMFCKDHITDSKMINLKNLYCITCSDQVSRGVRTDMLRALWTQKSNNEAVFCTAHKDEALKACPAEIFVDSSHNMCKTCEVERAYYGYLGYPAFLCRFCKRGKEHIVRIPLEKCYAEGCRIDGIGEFGGGIFCGKHLGEGGRIFINLCKICNSKANYNCEICESCERFTTILTPEIRIRKEIRVKTYLEAAGFSFVHDKCIAGGTTKYRPDFLISTPISYILIEVDENQHKKYESYCEEIRMINICNFDLQTSKPCIFIRYNPDKYIPFAGTMMVRDTERLGILMNIVRNWVNVASFPQECRIYVENLFFDGWGNGSRFIKEINPIAILSGGAAATASSSFEERVRGALISRRIISQIWEFGNFKAIGSYSEFWPGMVLICDTLPPTTYKENMLMCHYFHENYKMGCVIMCLRDRWFFENIEAFNKVIEEFLKWYSGKLGANNIIFQDFSLHKDFNNIDTYDYLSGVSRISPDHAPPKTVKID